MAGGLGSGFIVVGACCCGFRVLDEIEDTPEEIAEAKQDFKERHRQTDCKAEGMAFGTVHTGPYKILYANEKAAQA